MATPFFCASRILPAILLIGATAVSRGQRPGDLIITPTRIVLDEKAKSSDLTLLNRSARSIRYRLTLVDMEMTENGVLHRTDTTNDLSAITLLKLSPREILLDPGISQRIRIATFFPATQPDGEYRAHLVFEPIVTANPGPPVSAEGGDSLQLTLAFRSVISIPVIVRHGHVAATASLSDASVEKTAQGWVSKFTLHRSGNRSLRGDIKAEFQSNNGGPKTTLGVISGLSVFCPNPDRVVTLKLNTDLAKLGPGKILIRFTEPDRSRGALDVQTELSIAG